MVIITNNQTLKEQTMTNTITKIVSSTLASATILAALAMPANAGGQIQFQINAQNEKDEKAIKTGLAFYSIYKGIKSQGGITQNGNGNIAGVLQNGFGNQGIIHQQGDGHNGSIQQNGNNNSHGLFQFGKNTDAHVNQTGDNGAGATFTFGW